MIVHLAPSDRLGKLLHGRLDVSRRGVSAPCARAAPALYAEGRDGRLQAGDADGSSVSLAITVGTLSILSRAASIFEISLRPRARCSQFDRPLSLERGRSVEILVE